MYKLVQRQCLLHLYIQSYGPGVDSVTEMSTRSISGG